MPVRAVSLLLLTALTAWVVWRVLGAGLPALPLPDSLAKMAVARAAVGALAAVVLGVGWATALRVAVRRRARSVAYRAAAAEIRLDPERVRAATAGRQVNCPDCGKPVAVLKADRCTYCGTPFSPDVRQAMAAAREAILRDLEAEEATGREDRGSVV